jgi:hypothetical protein
VYHFGGATLQHGNPKKTFLNFRNSLLMMLKNLPKNQLLPVLFIRLILDGIAGIQFLMKGQFKHLLAILNAHYSFYWLFYKNYNKREDFQSTKYYYTKSIVYLYFINKVKVFINILGTK